MDGWFKIHRKILDWEWWNKPEMVKLLILFVCKANIEDREWQGISILRGQFVTSFEGLKIESGYSIQKIRTCIKRFEKTKEITIKSTSKYSIITICNYDDYQVFDNTNQQADQQTNNKQTTNEQQQYKKEKKDKNNNILPKGSAIPVGNATLNSEARKVFEVFFKETYSTDYYWTSKDAGSMTQLLKKISFQREQKGLQNDGKNILDALAVFLKSINNEWLLDNFSLPKINSQFNEILTQIYNNKNGKSKHRQNTKASANEQALELYRKSCEKRGVSNEIPKPF